METPLQKAVAIVGSESELARKLNISPQAVNQWNQEARKIPLLRVFAIEKLTGVRREELRPDIFSEIKHTEAA